MGLSSPLPYGSKVFRQSDCISVRHTPYRSTFTAPSRGFPATVWLSCFVTRRRFSPFCSHSRRLYVDRQFALCFSKTIYYFESSPNGRYIPRKHIGTACVYTVECLKWYNVSLSPASAVMHDQRELTLRQSDTLGGYFLVGTGHHCVSVHRVT